MFQHLILRSSSAVVDESYRTLGTPGTASEVRDDDFVIVDFPENGEQPPSYNEVSLFI